MMFLKDKFISTENCKRFENVAILSNVITIFFWFIFVLITNEDIRI